VGLNNTASRTVQKVGWGGVGPWGPEPHGPLEVYAYEYNNNNHDDIYSAVIMTEVIARVHSVHMVNVEQRQAAADPQTKPPDLG